MKFNRNKYDFGKKQEGISVDDLILPKWANGSAEEFILKNREALESDYVSENLHNWIDLIFGYKQKGEEAGKALNSYVNICYEGGFNLEKLIEQEKKKWEYQEQNQKKQNMMNDNSDSGNKNGKRIDKRKNSEDTKNKYATLKAKICQINCFGQIPLQLLTLPHQRRNLDTIKRQRKKFSDYKTLNPVLPPQLLQNNINAFLETSSDYVTLLLISY